MHYGWSDNDTLKAEKKLLDAMMMTGGFKLEDVPLAGDATMHTIRTGANAARDCKQAPILLIHGYAGGSALWAPLMARMVQDIRDRQIFAIDLPGVGLSRDKNGIRWSKGRAFLVGFGRSASVGAALCVFGLQGEETASQCPLSSQVDARYCGKADAVRAGCPPRAWITTSTLSGCG